MTYERALPWTDVALALVLSVLTSAALLQAPVCARLSARDLVAPPSANPMSSAGESAASIVVDASEATGTIGTLEGQPHLGQYEESGAWPQAVVHAAMDYRDRWAGGLGWDVGYGEVQNEPDINAFWTGTAHEYSQLHETTTGSAASRPSRSRGSISPPGVCG